MSESKSSTKGIGCLVLIVIGVIAYFVGSSKQKENISLMPTEQKTFVDAMNDYNKRYRDAINPVKRNDVYREWKEALVKQAASPKVVNWVGSIKTFYTVSKDEKINIAVILPGSTVIVSTFEDLFSSGSLIPKSSSLYSVLSSAKYGDTVIFSGEFNITNKAGRTHQNLRSLSRRS